LLAVVEADNIIHLYDTTSGALTAELRHDEAIWYLVVAFAPDGRSLAAGAMDPRGPAVPRVWWQIWDLASRKVTHTVSLEQVISPEYARYSPDGKWLAISGKDEVIVLNAATGAEVRRLPCLQRTPNIVFSVDGKTLASANTIWETDTWQRLPASADPATNLHGSFRYTNDGTGVIGSAGRLIVWNAATGQLVHRYPELPTFRGYSVLSPDQRLLAGVGIDRAVRLWDAVTGAEVRTLRDDKKPGGVYPVFAAGGRQLICGDSNGSIDVWDCATGERLAQLTGEATIAHWLAVSPDGRWLASATMGDPRTNSDVRIWDLSTHKQHRRFDALPQGALEFSPDSRYLVTSGADLKRSELQLWDIEGNKSLRTFEGHAGRAVGIAFSRDGRMLATGGRDTTVRVWEVATGAERCRFTGHKSAVDTVAFAPDCSAVAAASSEAPIYIWQVFGESHQSVREPEPANRDEKWIALASSDSKMAFQTVRRLVTDPTQSIAILREHLRAVVSADPGRVLNLIRQLESTKFTERQQASQELERILDGAVPNLRAALASTKSAETKQAIQRLLDRLDEQTPEMLRTMRAVEVLEHIATPAARELLADLAKGAAGARLTVEAKASLERLKAK
jgi:WD40 repeat protein